MNIQELTDIKTTINWLLENGTFKDAEKKELLELKESLKKYND